MAQYVGVGKTVAATFQESAIFSANGGQHAQRNVATLFESESLRARDVGTIRALRVQYVIADYRMTTQLPAEGSYFDRDPLAGLYGRPLPRAVLSKFDAAPGVTRSFDDGKIVVYDVRKGVSGG
jgi:hypothetical protein